MAQRLEPLKASKSGRRFLRPASMFARPTFGDVKEIASETGHDPATMTNLPEYAFSYIEKTRKPLTVSVPFIDPKKMPRMSERDQQAIMHDIHRRYCGRNAPETPRDTRVRRHDHRP